MKLVRSCHLFLNVENVGSEKRIHRRIAAAYRSCILPVAKINYVAVFLCSTEVTMLVLV